MTHQQSDDRSGLERRDLLKGLGFGAVGGSLLAGRAAGQNAQPATAELIDYAVLVPPGADPDTPQTDIKDTPDGGLDLVFQLDSPGMDKSGSHTIAYEMVLVSRDEGKIVTNAFEEGRARAFAGTVQTEPGGETKRREEFSVSGLGPDTSIETPNRYWAVLMVSDLSELAGGDGTCWTDYAAELFTVRHPMQKQ